MIIGGSSSSTAIEGGKAAQSQDKLEEDMNRFLNLLVTQLKNQDPLDPMDSTEFTSQLVQFASVEQQIQGNANLEKILSAQQNTNMGAMVSYIGNDAEAEGSSMPLQDASGAFSYTLDSNAQKATLTIRDSTGAVVYFSDADTTQGKHTFEWDGKTNTGIQQKDGIYTVNVSATNGQGEQMSVMHTVTGNVTGIRMEDGETYIGMDAGGKVLEIPFDKIVGVKSAGNA